MSFIACLVMVYLCIEVLLGVFVWYIVLVKKGFGSSMSDERFEILAKVTKRDKTSLVALVCWDGEKCCIVPKLEVMLHSYSNANVGTNGKIYRKKESRHEKPILEGYLDRVDLSLSLEEMRSLVAELRELD